MFRIWSVEQFKPNNWQKQIHWPFPDVRIWFFQKKKKIISNRKNHIRIRYFFFLYYFWSLLIGQQSMNSVSGETVLIVDYDRLNRNNMEKTLQKSSYNGKYTYKIILTIFSTNFIFYKRSTWNCDERKYSSGYNWLFYERYGWIYFFKSFKTSQSYKNSSYM